METPWSGRYIQPTLLRLSSLAWCLSLSPISLGEFVAMSYNDENKLASLGYKQEFKRVFSPFEVFGVAFSIIGLFPSIA